jgi:3,4-dihydroxy 2-butanone 4-phosphate synthase/GTP cyclohydrolase II
MPLDLEATTEKPPFFTVGDLQAASAFIDYARGKTKPGKGRWDLENPNTDHVACERFYIYATWPGAESVLVRVHSECLTGDVFHSLLCDCGEQLEQALARIEAEGRGVVLYMSQEGRGIGLLAKLKAYGLQASGLDTVEANVELGFPADAREWGIGNQILADLGLTTIRILTNNPRKLTGLDGYGLTVTEQVPIEVEPNPENARYLATKREKLGHTLASRLHHQGARLEPETTPEGDE